MPSPCKYCQDSRFDGGEVCGHCSIWCEACEQVKDRGPAAAVGNYFFCAECIDGYKQTIGVQFGFNITDEGAIYSLAVRRFGSYPPMVRAVRPHLTPGEVQAIGKPIPCSHCDEAPALVARGSNYCEKCEEALWPSKYRREQDDYERTMGDQMEASGASLEPSVRSAGGGMGRAWPGARFTDYDGSDE